MNEVIDPKPEVRAWIAKAEADFTAVRLLLLAGKDCPTDIVCFHAQQCVEKYLKGLLCLSGVDFPRNHDINELVVLLPKDAVMPLSVKEQENLSEYAVDARYPGLEKEIEFSEAAQAAKWAETARAALRSSFPEDVL